MKRHIPILLLATAFVGTSLLGTPREVRAQESEADLLKKLSDPDAPIFDMAMACKELSRIGTEAAVPVLAKMLGDDETLSHYARYALVPNPSPKVDEVLVAALSKQKGRTLIGTINSIANRGKPSAVEALGPLLDAEDEAVAAAAAHAIARLGSPIAAELLEPRISPEMAPAILVCGKTLAEQGHKATAAHMLTELSKLSDAPDFLRLSGLLHSIVLKEKDGLAMLRQAIGSDDHEEMAMALRAARLIDTEDATQVALAALDGASARQRALLVILLGDLNTQGSLPVMLEAVKAKEAAVRLAAVTALGSLGSIEHVAILARAAGDKDSAVADAAVGALTELDGEDVDKAVLELLDDAATQKTAIQLIGLRRIESAVDTLLGLLDGPHQTDVVTALGETLALDQLDVLGDRLNSDSDELREAVQAALHAACYRMPDRDATAAKLGEYLEKGKDAVPYVMEELRVLGGKKALEIVAAAANSDDDLLQDYATRELGEWLDTSVAETLLELAKKEGDSKYGIRAIRGYIRLARQFSMPDEEHAEICQTALKIASRTPEKKLALEALLRNSNLASLAVAVEAAQEADIKQQATQTARAIAEQISGKRRAVAALLEQLE